MIRVNDRPLRTLGRGVRRFTLSFAGYDSGVAEVSIKATTTKGGTLVGTRTYRLCGYTGKPLTRLIPLHTRARRR